MHPGSFLGETTEERPWVDPGQTKDIVSWLFWECLGIFRVSGHGKGALVISVKLFYNQILM